MKRKLSPLIHFVPLKLCIGLVFCFLVFSCKKVQRPLQQDSTSCDCAEETSADFKIIESATDVADYGDFLTETDTAYTNRNIYFIATQKGVEYKWYIGNEILTDSVVGRYFPNSAVENQTISITLVVKRKPNNICFPNDDGYDSIVKTIHFVKLPEVTGTLQPYPINQVGTYRVKMPHLPDSHDITIGCMTSELSSRQVLSVSNYDGFGNNIEYASPYPSLGFRLFYRNYSEIQLGEGPYASQGNYFFGRLRRLLNTNIYEFDISLGASNPANSGYVKRKYIGRKIN